MKSTLNEKKMVNEFDDVIEGNVLDLGGGGTFDSEIKSRYKNVTNVDFMKDETVDVLWDLNKGVPFSNNSFKTILCSNIIEHLENPLYFLREIKRVLKRGGKAIIITPNGFRLSELVANLFNITPSFDETYPYTYHIYIWNKFNFVLLAKEAGLKILYFKYVSHYWRKNYPFRALAYIMPILRPALLFVLTKDENK